MFKMFPAPILINLLANIMHLQDVSGIQVHVFNLMAHLSLIFIRAQLIQHQHFYILIWILMIVC